MLTDNFKRKMDYLRISITDRCNLRCMYCMPREGIETVPQKQLLTFEEIIRLVKILATLGVRRVRLTGGEPLVRKGLICLIDALGEIEGIEEVLLTTNGVLLPFCAERLKSAGIKRINISLDTLDRSTFRMVCGNDCINHVFEGIQKAKDVGFKPIKLNTVIIKGINDNEITDFMEFALSQGLILRFIEFMKITPLWRENLYIPIEEIKDICNRRFKLRKVGKIDASPAEYYENTQGGLLGFIKTDENNCRNCNRLRITSRGELKICLYENEGLRLQSLLRSDASDGEISDIVRAKIGLKEYTDYRNYESPEHYMCNIGG